MLKKLFRLMFGLFSAQCKLSMNHDRDGLEHETDHACEYQKQFDNRDYLCKVSARLKIVFCFNVLLLVFVSFYMTGVANEFFS
jgi:hypothetical protein